MSVRSADLRFARFSKGVAVAGAPTLIAHAGGVTADGRYSNTLEAIEEAYEAGIRAIEVDLSFTADGHIVLIHDWGQTWDYWFPPPLRKRSPDALASPGPPTLAAFAAAPVRGGRTALTLPALCGWLEKHPDVRAFFDLKATLERMLPQAAEDCAGVRQQVVVYLPDDRLVAFARGRGFRQLAVSNYYRQFGLPDMQKLAASGRFDFVDLGLDDFSMDEIAVAVDWGIPVVTWTVNVAETAQQLAGLGVAAIITDVLRPAGDPILAATEAR